MGIEPTTSPLPREYSTTELHQPESGFGRVIFEVERKTGLEPVTLSLEG